MFSYASSLSGFEREINGMIEYSNQLLGAYQDMLGGHALYGAVGRQHVG